MGSELLSDEDLLSAPDGASFELFYRRHAERMLGYFVRRTRDAELAADLTAETFAAALVSRRRYRAEVGNASTWLFAIASKKLIDAQRRGYAERRARRRLGMQRIELTVDDIARIESLAGIEVGSLIEVLVPDQRVAVQMNGLFLVDNASLSRVNPRNLHALWRTPIPSIGPGVAADGRLWVETTGRRGDRILTVDPRNGGVIDSVDVGEFGAQWMDPVGSEVWMTTAGGHVVIQGR